jgi:cell division septum initiation protein DivIVA
MAMMSSADQRLTPDAVQTISFRSARLGRRGFDEEHVRAFCRHVEAELVVLHSERSLLQEEVGRLRRRILGDPDGPPGLRRGGGTGSAVGILSRAQQTAEHYVAEAQEYSRHVTRDAQRRRDGMVAGVRANLDRVIEQAHDEACRAARTALAPATSPAAVREVRAELAYLRTFGDVYTERLRACLDDLLRDTGWADDHDGADEGVLDVTEDAAGMAVAARRAS